jgi:hypothetical protein
MTSRDTLDDTQERSLSVLVLDERSTGETALGFHKGSTGAGADGVPVRASDSS